jgi:ABC-type multidrug transport system fused ATPase/permease subunit
MNLIHFLALSAVLLLASLLSLAWLIRRIKQKMPTPVALSESKSKQIRTRLHALAVLLIAVILAGIPPALVMVDRWFHFTSTDLRRAISTDLMHAISTDLMGDIWCQSSYLCQIWLPSYFLIVFASVAGLLVFMFLQRREPVVVVENSIVSLENSPAGEDQARVGFYFIAGSACGFMLIVLLSLIDQQYPGWSLVLVWLTFLMGCFLRAFALASILNSWKRNGEFWISILLAFVSIVGILVGYFGQPQIFWTTVVLLILVMANLWRFRRRVPLIFWIVSLALIVYTININVWWTAVVGDEYGFHDLARQLVEKTGFAELGQVLFRADGVNGTHPYLSSILQAIPMKFLGDENFGWRFSNPLMCSLAVGLFYLFCKTFISKRLSLVAAFLIAVSSYVISFGKIGYNNLQALFALALVLALSAWALRSRLPLAFACLGSAMALCFYIYPAALYVIPLPFLLLSLYYPPLTREVTKRWMHMFIVWIALLFPLMLQPIYWQTKVAGTFLNQPDLLQSFSTILDHFVNNIVYAFFSFLYIPVETQFVVSSYLDPLTAAFFLIGFCLLIYQLRRQRFALFVLLSLIFFILTVGASHDRATPPTTRMFLLLPLYALIASWGVIWVEAKARQAFSARAGILSALLPILLVTIAGANLYQAYSLSQIRSTNYQMLEALFIRISQHIYEAKPTSPQNYAVVVNESGGIEGLLELQQVYPHLAWAQIHQIRIPKPVLSEANLPLLADRNTSVILAPWLDPVWVTALDAPLRALGKESCDILTAAGEKRFVLYHDPDLPRACDP